MTFYISATLMLLSLSGFVPYDFVHNQICNICLIAGCIFRISGFNIVFTYKNIFGGSRVFSLPI